MREDITARIANAQGVHITEIVTFGSNTGASVDYAMNVGKPSACRIALPASVDESQFPLDGRIGIWRAVGGYGPFLESGSVYLIRKWEYTRDATIVTGYHANSLMSRRCVLYNKASTFANKATPTAADNLIKDIWDENFGAAISAANRDGAETGADISAYVSTQSDLSSSAAISGQFGRRNVADSFEELAQAAALSGGYLAVEIVSSSDSALQLRTYPIARGVDRRAGANPLVFSEEMGTLTNAKLVVDHTDEKTFVVAVGAGNDDLRLVQSALDTSRLNASPLNRIEHVINLSNVSDDTELAFAALSELRKHEPLIYVTGEIPDGSPLVRGVDYNYGDLAYVEMRGKRLSVRLDALHCSIGPASRTTQCILRSFTT